MPNKSLKIQLSQLNFTVGDLAGNCRKILESYAKAIEQGVDLVVFSELAITGYPPEDLLHKKYFLDEVEEKIEEIRAASLGKKTAILLGVPTVVNYELPRGTKPPATKVGNLQNSAIIIEDGETIAIAGKTCLPNYGVFDEHRYFKPAATITNFEFRGLRLIILVCEDIWHLKNAFILGDKIFDAIISINASPFTFNKVEQRLKTVKKFIKDLKKPVIYVNQIGGQDDVLFDGGSFVMGGDGEVIAQMKEFEEDCQIVKLCESKIGVYHPPLEGGSSSEAVWGGVRNLESKKNNNVSDLKFSHPSQNFSTENFTLPQGEGDSPQSMAKKMQRIYNATILALRDYIQKNGFTKVLIGMSGGIDSALVAAIAVDALGSDNVKLVALPTKYNSQTSMDDAIQAAENLGIKLEVINIQNAVEALNEALEEQFNYPPSSALAPARATASPLGGDYSPPSSALAPARATASPLGGDTTEENIQSRIRGNILMALSNKFGHLLLSTGNKSELAVGYATIYGDMCGAFNPLKDIYKTEVFELAKWRNENIPPISIYKNLHLTPKNIITKAPTAELRENQKDSDSLPEYEILDQILYQLIEEEKSILEIVKSGFEKDLVSKIAKLFLNSEYKRKQAVIGVKVSEKSFDRDRRYPITNKFKK